MFDPAGDFEFDQGDAERREVGLASRASSSSVIGEGPSRAATRSLARGGRPSPASRAGESSGAPRPSGATFGQPGIVGSPSNPAVGESSARERVTLSLGRAR